LTGSADDGDGEVAERGEGAGTGADAASILGEAGSRGLNGACSRCPQWFRVRRSSRSGEAVSGGRAGDEVDDLNAGLTAGISFTLVGGGTLF
jgi:hypothetical protein